LTSQQAHNLSAWRLHWQGISTETCGNRPNLQAGMCTHCLLADRTPAEVHGRRFQSYCTSYTDSVLSQSWRQPAACTSSMIMFDHLPAHFDCHWQCSRLMAIITQGQQAEYTLAAMGMDAAWTCNNAA
jgi:hypothetical protein